MPGLVSQCPECGRWQAIVVSTADVLLARGKRTADEEAARVADVDAFLAGEEIVAGDPDETCLIDLRSNHGRAARCVCGDVVRLKDLGRIERLEEV